MSYTQRPQIFSFDLKSADLADTTVNDNTDLFSIMIPAGREVQIQALYGHVRAASDGADFIELVKEDDTLISKIALQTTGKKSGVAANGSTATTFPQVVVPQSTSAVSLLKLRTDGATDASTDVTIQIHISGLL